jgi:LytS/YehU family sensor histidine kinase
MNWKLIFVLSLFAIPMAFATVYYIPQNVEPVFWLVIFLACAFIIAKVATRKYFLHGFMVSIFNCVWITAIHFIFFAPYYANHPNLAEMKQVTPETMRYAGLVIGPVIGIISGLILGLFSFVAAKILRR